jgi:hypothetical protein
MTTNQALEHWIAILSIHANAQTCLAFGCLGFIFALAIWGANGGDDGDVS